MKVIYPCGCEASIWFHPERSSSVNLNSTIDMVCRKHQKDAMDDLIKDLKLSANASYGVRFGDDK